jgi:hypothetical protein
MRQLVKQFKHVFFFALSAMSLSCGLGTLEKPVFGIQDDATVLEVVLGPSSDDVSGYVDVDEELGFFGYDIASDSVVNGHFDIENGMVFGSAESLAGDLFGDFAFDIESGDLYYYDFEFGDFSEHNVFASAEIAPTFAFIGPIVRVVVNAGRVAGPVIIKGGKWAGGKIYSGGKWVGGKIYGGGQLVYGKIWGPKPLTSKQKAVQQYMKNIGKKGANNQPVQKIDPTDFE